MLPMPQFALDCFSSWCSTLRSTDFQLGAGACVACFVEHTTGLHRDLPAVIAAVDAVNKCLKDAVELTPWRSAGFSNLASGLAGAGFTGSYIFSQTIFSMRAGVMSRLNGGVIACVELVLFLLPKSVCNSVLRYYLKSSVLATLGTMLLMACWNSLSFHCYNKSPSEAIQRLHMCDLCHIPWHLPFTCQASAMSEKSGQQACGLLWLVGIPAKGPTEQRQRLPNSAKKNTDHK